MRINKTHIKAISKDLKKKRFPGNGNGVFFGGWRIVFNRPKARFIVFKGKHRHRFSRKVNKFKELIENFKESETKVKIKHKKI
jgi:hypothetical protein